MRGDSVDIYLSGADEAVRVEFFGDEIDQLSIIDPISGAEREHIEEIAIATPATFTRYANAFRGNIYGYPCTAVDGAVTRVLRAEEERYIPGLDFVGSAGIRAHGYSSVITNGYDIAGVALEKLGGE